MRFLIPGQCLEFVNGKQVDVANVAVFPQQAVMTVVEIMAFGPVAIRHKTHHTADFTDDIIGFSGGREGLVTAVVLNDENSNQEEGIYEGQWKHQPERNVNQQIHGNPDSYERQKSVQDLDGGLA